MTETVRSSDSELHRPREFTRLAGRDLRGAGLVAHRLFRAQLAARYRRGRLGYLWLLLPTVGMTVVWVYVDARRIVDFSSAEVPYTAFVLAGVILWQTFVDALGAPLQALTANRQVVTRSRVPHEALLLAAVYEVLFNFAARFIVLAAVLLALEVGVDRSVLLVPLGVAALTALGFALGILVTPLGLLYDDVSRAILLITGLWFFLTPIVYATPAGGLLRLNPVTPLLGTTRSWLLTGAAAPGFGWVTAAALVTLGGAWLLYRLALPHVVARLG